MIKVKIKNGPIILGLDWENLKRLKEPGTNTIIVKGSDLGIEYDFYIVVRETLDEIMEELKLPRIQ